jgi:hypothetical protein
LDPRSALLEAGGFRDLRPLGDFALDPLAAPALTSGSASTSLTALLSSVTISIGVLAGAASAFQLVMS